MPTDNDLVNPGKEGFVERVTPLKPSEDVFFFKCKKKIDGRFLTIGATECGGTHFRHAGYLQTMLPFMRAGGDKRVSVDSVQVMVCVKCRACYVWINEQMYDVTAQVDLEAWEKFEKDAHRATGPGGQC